MGSNRPANARDLSPSRRQLTGYLLIALLVLGITQWQWFKPGIAFTHDGESRLVRQAQYYLTIKEGQFPPRFAGDINNGFGYPVFNFNYPLPDMLAYPLIVLNLPVTLVMKIISLGAVLVGFLGMALFLNRLLKPIPGLVGAGFYTLNPYVIELLYVRGSIGELLAWSIYPWLFYLSTRLCQTKRWRWLNGGLLGLLGGLFLISHNVMVLLGIPLFLGYVTYLHFRFKPEGFKLGLPIVTMMLLGAFFWIPALMEKQYTVLDQASITQNYAEHFPTLKELLTGAWGYGFSYPGPVDGLSFSVGIAQLLILVWAFIMAVKLRSRNLIILLGLITGVILMMLSPAAPIWRFIPFLNYIQFPWRLLFFTEFLIAITAGVVITETMSWPVIWLGLVIVLTTGALAISAPQKRVDLTNQDLFYATETTSTMDEDMPIWFDKNTDYQLKDTYFKDRVVMTDPAILPVQVQVWTGSRHDYSLTAGGPVQVIERAAYFPGWEVKVDGQPVKIDYQDKKFPGLITYQLIPGNHQVKTSFTQNTWPRKIGNSLSLLGLGLLVIGTIYERIREKK